MYREQYQDTKEQPMPAPQKQALSAEEERKILLEEIYNYAQEAGMDLEKIQKRAEHVTDMDKLTELKHRLFEEKKRIFALKESKALKKAETGVEEAYKAQEKFADIAGGREVEVQYAKFGEMNCKLAGSGRPVKNKNEDKAFANLEKGAMVVCDGVSLSSGKQGLESPGKKAAEFAASKLMEVMERIPNDSDVEKTKEIIRKAFLEINREMLKFKETSGQTTACAAKLLKREDGTVEAIIAGVGDSPAFVRRANGKIEKITRDDNALTEIADSLNEKLGFVQGFVKKLFSGKEELEKKKIEEFSAKVGAETGVFLNAKEAEDYMRILKENKEISLEALPEKLRKAHKKLGSKLKQCFGKSENLAPQIYNITLNKGDKLLMGSDGIDVNVAKEKLSENFSEDLEKGVLESLNDAFLGEHEDDLTLLAIEIGAEKREAEKRVAA